MGDDRIRVRVIDFDLLENVDDIRTLINAESQIIDNLKDRSSSIGYYLFDISLAQNIAIENGYMYEREQHESLETVFLFKCLKNQVVLYPVDTDSSFLINNDEISDHSKTQVFEGDIIELDGSRFVINRFEDFNLSDAKKLIGKILVKKSSESKKKQLEILLENEMNELKEEISFKTNKLKSLIKAKNQYEKNKIKISEQNIALTAVIEENKKLQLFLLEGQNNLTFKELEEEINSAHDLLQKQEGKLVD